MILDCQIKKKHTKMGPCDSSRGGGVLSYLAYIGMCGPKG